MTPDPRSPRPEDALPLPPLVEIDIDSIGESVELEPGALPMLERYRRGQPQRKRQPLLDPPPRPKR